MHLCNFENWKYTAITYVQSFKQIYFTNKFAILSLEIPPDICYLFTCLSNHSFIHLPIYLPDYLYNYINLFIIYLSTYMFMCLSFGLFMYTHISISKSDITTSNTHNLYKYLFIHLRVYLSMNQHIFVFLSSYVFIYVFIYPWLWINTWAPS